MSRNVANGFVRTTYVIDTISLITVTVVYLFRRLNCCLAVHLSYCYVFMVLTLSFINYV